MWLIRESGGVCLRYDHNCWLHLVAILQMITLFIGNRGRKHGMILVSPLARGLPKRVGRDNLTIFILEFLGYSSHRRDALTFGDQIANIQFRHSRNGNRVSPLDLVDDTLLLRALSKDLIITSTSQNRRIRLLPDETVTIEDTSCVHTPWVVMCATLPF